MMIKNIAEWDALIHYHREAMHRYPESLHVSLVEWVDNERAGEGMTRGEFASHCLECLRIEREDARDIFENDIVSDDMDCMSSEWQDLGVAHEVTE